MDGMRWGNMRLLWGLSHLLLSNKVKKWVSEEVGKVKEWKPQMAYNTWLPSRLLLHPTITDKSLGTLLHFWGNFQFTQVQPLPSPHKQCLTHVSRIFSQFQLCIGWGEGELQENLQKDAPFWEGTEKWQKNMNISVLSQGLLSRIVWILVLGEKVRFPMLFRHFGDK